jgi:hypothetical protein
MQARAARAPENSESVANCGVLAVGFMGSSVIYGRVKKRWPRRQVTGISYVNSIAYLATPDANEPLWCYTILQHLAENKPPARFPRRIED